MSDRPSRQLFFPNPASLAAALGADDIGIWSLDVASTRMTWSPNLEAVHGLLPGRFDGRMASFESHIHPDDHASAVAAIQETLQTGKPRRTQYRMAPQPDADAHWVECSTSAVMENDVPVQVIGICRDVTERSRVYHELRGRVRQQEAIASLGERALTEIDLQKFFDEAVTMIATILDLDLVKILELVPGDAELVLRAGVGWKPGLVGTALVTTGRESQAGFTLASGVPVVVTDLAEEVRFTGQWLLRDHGAVSGVSVPIAGRDGRAYGVLTVHATRRRRFGESDIAFITAAANVIAGAIQRRQLDQRHELMIRELRHRSGNLFAQLLALFSQTAKNSRSVADLVPKYEARVLALANAHRLITEGGWKSASLVEVLNTLLAPYLDRITFAGPNVYLEPDPVFGLSMAVHELLTNAMKHGSLSQRPGRTEVTWHLDRTGQGLTLVFDWKEREGPVLRRRSRREGFGTRLINMVIGRQLNGAVKQSFGPEGLDVQLIIPLTNERWSGVTVPTAMPAEPH